MSNLPMDTTVVVTPGLVCCDLAGDTAILHLDTGTYFTLNAVATAIWRLLQEPARVSDLHRFLVERYEVEAESCAGDLQSLLHDLLAHDLVTIHT